MDKTNAEFSSVPERVPSGLTPDAAVLFRAGRVLNSTLDLSELQDAVLQLLIDTCDAETAILLLVERKTQDFVLMRAYDRRTNTFSNFPIRVANRLFSWIQRENPTGSGMTKELPRRVESALDDVVPQEERQTAWSSLRRGGRLSGAIGIITTGHSETNRWVMITALADQIATALDNALLFRAVKRRSSEARILLQSSLALSGSLDLDEILTTILDKLQAVIEFDAAGVFLFDREDKELIPISHRGFDDNKRHLLRRKSDEGLVGSAVSRNEVVLVRDVNADPRYKNARDATRSELVIPIAALGRLIGAFDLERDIIDGFSAEDVSLATAFAGIAGVAIERARLYRETLDKHRLDDELQIARSIQESFLPKSDPDLPGFEIAGLNVPSEAVGGDYYDFIPIVENQVGIAIGDVSGKGIPAALIMAAFRASLIAEIRNNYAIRTIFAKVNSLMEETSERGRFVSGLYGVLDAKNKVLTFANAGHNPGLLCRQDGTIEYLTEGGPLFGVVRDQVYEERPISLRSGDFMLWYTDGVTEAENENEELFGEDRLEQLLRDHAKESATSVLGTIHRAVNAFASPDATMDDLTMVAVKVLQ